MKPFFAAAIAALIGTVWLGTLQTAEAQANPFEPGWVLEPGASSLRFQSIKGQSKIESSSFATLSGGIDPLGNASLTVLLDSVDTKIDLRNVRMRFLFFETFQYPEAKVSLSVDPSVVADLAQVRRKVVRLPFTLELHGEQKQLEADLALTLIGDDLVAVSTNDPVTIALSDFNLIGGLEKLQEAANVEIIPSTTVTFELIFKRLGTGQQAPVQVATSEAPASAALETKGDFSLEACVGRFEILSRTGNIYFATGSARLDDKSVPLLNQVADIVARCPGLVIQVSGHTDSMGSDSANQRLSERRAGSVADYLAGKGIPRDRMVSVGMGESQPVASNDTRDGRGKNRRIEFSVATN